MAEVTTTQFAAALRELADIYEAHPEMAAPPRIEIYLTLVKREEFAHTVKALGSVQKVPPSRSNDYFFSVERSMAGVPVRFTTARSSVCRKVRRMEMVDAWDCSDPILESLVTEGANATHD